ncbi:MAG: SURF1 family protein [bacterium]
MDNRDAATTPRGESNRNHSSRKKSLGAAAAYVLFFASLSLLLTLGGWQWRRGVEKAAIERVLMHANDHYITVARAPRDWQTLAHRRVRLDGEWLAPIFLLANRTHRGRLGHEAFSPYRLADDGAVILVNRGWTADANTANFDINVDANDANDDDDARGYLYLPQSGFTLGAAIAPGDRAQNQPQVIQHLDLPALSAETGIKLHAAAVALDNDHPHALTPIWRAVAIPSARHFGYAAQWWGLSLTLIIFGVIWRRRARRIASRAGESLRR